MTQQLRPDRAGPSAVDRFFRITSRGSTVARELRGGLTTFVAMAYIVMLNPLILGSSRDATGAQLSPEQLTTATAATAGVMTIAMGLVGNAPLALAAGLGVNAVVAFTIAPAMTWAQAFGLVVLEGVVIVVLAVSGVREKVINAIPAPLKTALTVGIGLYIALIGLVSAGFVTRKPDAAGTTVPVQMGQGPEGHLVGAPIAVFCLSLLLVLVLLARKVPGAMLIGIAVSTVVAIVVHSAFGVPPEQWGTIVPELPDRVVGSPDFSTFGQVDLFGGFAAAGGITATVFLFTLVLSGFFDAMGTITSVSTEAGLVRGGRVEGMGRILAVDGVAAAAGGLTGASPNTVFLESATGVAEGARTGLASVVTGLLFCATLLFTPLAAVVPAQAAAPALVVVGALMMAQVRHVPWDDPEHVVPAFLTIAVIPFTYMITNGIGAGLIAYAVIKVARGKAREIGWLVGVLAVVFAAYFGIEAVEALVE
ncbi:NCS2 family permease [Saccharopolyspora hordei]|uniref:AGZA family xanthine/uracil permease-like MFS transporter n=1 Tax=Saccharopolyspora hordei TaxID=1838 RepID=A0A853AUB2_9PSEU|nr:NCS2 family permease [Saccharopolyspora hordei]NYI86240.1 AGZA family xanthine/uracil permease-like MFS transporter [Saccharopolyspora hordei]